MKWTPRAAAPGQTFVGGHAVFTHTCGHDSKPQFFTNKCNAEMKAKWMETEKCSVCAPKKSAMEMRADHRTKMMAKFKR